MLVVDSHSEMETANMGAAFATWLKSGDVVALFGGLGVGKTQFIKGVCRGLGVKEHVSSPTFTIVNEYRGENLPAYHFDFYRLKQLRELREIGFEEYLNGNGVCFIEWAENVSELLPEQRYEVRLELKNDASSRRIVIEQMNKVTA